ncbi:methyl-accepting chemotaxis protein [Thermodesulfobacteriota bacterium]
MRGLKLKNKLILGSLTLVILVMAVSTVVVSVIINKQNRAGSNNQLQKALNVVRFDLAAIKEKHMTDSRQMATINGMGSKVKFLYELKDNTVESLTSSAFKEMTNDILQVGKNNNMWKMSVYDNDGDLVSFAAQSKGESFIVGYCYNHPNLLYQIAEPKDDATLASEDWKGREKFPDVGIPLKFGRKIPQEERSFFVQAQDTLCLISYIPVFGKEFNEKSEKFEQMQVGFVSAIQKLDQRFVRKMSALTGLRINLFNHEGGSIGEVKDYKQLHAEAINKADDKWRLSRQKIFFNDVDLQTESYFQGILPLYNDSGHVGTIAALQSKGVSRANTWQMILIMSLVYSGCILLVIPIVVLFSNSFAKPINNIITSLAGTAQRVSSASSQVSTSSQKQADDTAGQASSLEESSASLEEISSMVRQNAEHAREVDDLMQVAQQIVGKSTQSMENLTSSMADISKASKETSKIIQTIDEIAFQTNLLALNAAVEAARAGEAGAGFAVVADEVRNLAMRAADAAKNTAELIEGTTTRVKEGSQLVTENASAFSELAEKVVKVGDVISEIAKASSEQASGIEQVNRAVTEMDKLTQQNASNAEESASASQDLNAQAEQMGRIVRALVTLVGGHQNPEKDGGGSLESPGASIEGLNEGGKMVGKEMSAPKTIEVPPDQIIPLMDDDDFKDF